MKVVLHRPKVLFVDERVNEILHPVDLRVPMGGKVEIYLLAPELLSAG